jgi:4-amino-4-deoxy-L-arabinose transferase-like glycosyltransferase
MNKKNQWHYIALSIILVIAIFFRFMKLSTLPYGMSSLEAKTALSSMQALKHPDHLLSLSRDHDNNIIYGTMQHASISILGTNPLGARLPSAILGIILVWLVYYFVNRFFHHKAALWAMLAVAINFSAVHFSRLAISANLVPVLSIISLILFYEIFINETKNKKYYIALVLLNIISIYLYTQFAWLIMAEIIGIIYKLWKNKDDRRAKRFIILIAIMIVAIATKIIANSGDNGIISTIISGTFLDSKINGGNPLTSLIGSVYHSISIFLISGDSNTEFNISKLATFNTFFTIGLILGLIYIIKNKKYPLYYQSLIVLIVGLIMASFNPVNSTSMLRLNIFMPLMFAIVGIGVSTMQSFLKHKLNLKNNHIITPALLGACVILSVCLTFIQYFYNWNEDYSVANIYQSNSLTFMLKELPNSENSKFIVYDKSAPTSSYDFIIFGTKSNHSVQVINLDELASMDLNSTKDSTFYVLETNNSPIDQISTRIKQKYSEVKAESITDSTTGKVLYYKIKPGA